jgi:elongator complex protein 3
LIKEAEKLTAKSGTDIIAVISGVGVRDYYRKLGYRLEKTYMIKKI